MTMQPHVLRNLTMASAKHLVGQGHISKAHHAKIMMKVKAPAMAPNKPPALPKAGGGPKMAPMAMSQAQLEAPVPMGALDAAPQMLRYGAGHEMGVMPRGPGDTSVDE